MTGMSAGVLRSPAIISATSRAEGPGFGSVGTNLANRLDRAEQQHIGTNT